MHVVLKYVLNVLESNVACPPSLFIKVALHKRGLNVELVTIKLAYPREESPIFHMDTRPVSRPDLKLQPGKMSSLNISYSSINEPLRPVRKIIQPNTKCHTDTLDYDIVNNRVT